MTGRATATGTLGSEYDVVTTGIAVTTGMAVVTTGTVATGAATTAVRRCQNASAGLAPVEKYPITTATAIDNCFVIVNMVRVLPVNQPDL
jgi:hypothetical protein